MLTLELSEQMGDGKGHRLRGMCWLLEEDEASAAFWKGGSEIKEEKKSTASFFSSFGRLYFC